MFGEKDEPEVIGTSAALTTNPAGTTFALLRPDNTVRLLVAPPLPLPEQRIVHVPQHDSVRILGPLAEALAELPSNAVTLQNGIGGVFLSADLPDGLPGDPGAFRLLMAAHNRYLLRADE